MEYLDVLDEKGNPTGEKKSRAEVHRDGDWHRSVRVWIMNSVEELLIQKRSLRKEHNPGLWDTSCAGHVPAGESPLDTVVRESREELSISLSRDDLESLGVVKDEERTVAYWDREFALLYLIKCDIDLSAIRLQREEVSEVRWIDFRELEKSIRAGDAAFGSHPEEYKKLFEILQKRYD